VEARSRIRATMRERIGIWLDVASTIEAGLGKPETSPNHVISFQQSPLGIVAGNIEEFLLWHGQWVSIDLYTAVLKAFSAPVAQM